MPRNLAKAGWMGPAPLGGREHRQEAGDGEHYPQEGWAHGAPRWGCFLGSWKEGLMLKKKSELRAICGGHEDTDRVDELWPLPGKGCGMRREHR